MDPKWERRECCRTTCAAESQIARHTSASGSSIVKKTSLYTRAVPVRRRAKPWVSRERFQRSLGRDEFLCGIIIRNRERKKEDKRAATVRRGVYNTNNTTVTSSSSSSSSSSFAHLVVVILDFSNDHAIFHALFVSRDLPSFPFLLLLELERALFGDAFGGTFRRSEE